MAGSVENDPLRRKRASLSWSLSAARDKVKEQFSARGNDMRRREFIGAASAAALAVAATCNARAEQKAQRIAFAFPSIPVSRMTETSGDPLFQGFVQRTPSLGICRGAESSD